MKVFDAASKPASHSATREGQRPCSLSASAPYENELENLKYVCPMQQPQAAIRLPTNGSEDDRRQPTQNQAGNHPNPGTMPSMAMLADCRPCCNSTLPSPMPWVLHSSSGVTWASNCAREFIGAMESSGRSVIQDRFLSIVNSVHYWQWGVGRLRPTINVGWWVL